MFAFSRISTLRLIGKRLFTRSCSQFAVVDKLDHNTSYNQFDCHLSGQSRSSASASSPCYIYQHTFGSYQSLIAKEKEEANDYILVEDKTLRLEVDDKYCIERILDSPLTNFWEYWLKDRHYFLIDLADAESFAKKNQTILSEAKFPISTKFFSLNKLPGEKDSKKLIKKRYDLRLHRQSVKSADNMNLDRPFDETISRFTSNLAQNELECKLKFFVINAFEHLLCRGVFNAFQLVPFGSSVNSLGWGSSGLDLCLTTKYDPHPSKTLVSSTVGLLDGAIGRQKCIKMYTTLMNVDLIPGVNSVNQPNNQTIKLFSNFTATDVIITCADSTALEFFKMSEILYQIARADERILCLIHFCKLWAEVQGIISQTLNNVILIMLIVNYLQVRRPFPILPPLEPFFRESDILLNPRDIRDKSTPFKDLLAGFFCHLGTFDFVHSGANPFLGKIVRKATKDVLFILDPAKGNNMAVKVTKKDLDNLSNFAMKSYKLLGTGCHPKMLLKPIPNDIYTKVTK